MKKKGKAIIGIAVGVVAVATGVALIKNVDKPGNEPSISVPAADDTSIIHSGDNLVDKVIYINYDNLIKDTPTLVGKSNFYDFAHINLDDVEFTSEKKTMQSFSPHFTIGSSPTMDNVYYLKFYVFCRRDTANIYRGVCDNYDLSSTLDGANFTIKLTDTDGVAVKNGVVKYTPFVSMETSAFKVNKMSLSGFNNVDLSKYFAFSDIWTK